MAGVYSEWGRCPSDGKEVPVFQVRVWRMRGNVADDGAGRRAGVMYPFPRCPEQGRRGLVEFTLSELQSGLWFRGRENRSDRRVAEAETFRGPLHLAGFRSREDRGEPPPACIHHPQPLQWR